MTIKEAVTALIPFEVSDNLTEKTLTDRSLTGSDTYNVSYLTDVEITAAFILKYYATVPDFREGSLSLTYDRNQIVKMANSLFIKNGLNSEVIKIKPKVRFNTL